MRRPRPLPLVVDLRQLADQIDVGCDQDVGVLVAQEVVEGLIEGLSSDVGRIVVSPGKGGTVAGQLIVRAGYLGSSSAEGHLQENRDHHLPPSAAAAQIRLGEQPLDQPPDGSEPAHRRHLDLRAGVAGPRRSRDRRGLVKGGEFPVGVAF